MKLLIAFDREYQLFRNDVILYNTLNSSLAGIISILLGIRFIEDCIVYRKAGYCRAKLRIKNGGNIMTIHAPDFYVDNANSAKNLLVEGNKRFVSGELQSKASYAEDRKTLLGGQKPFATILSCSDSRVVPEILFDQKLGDLFVIRNAGNVLDDAVLGTIEYAAGHLKCPLIVVLGHNLCGAVTSAVGKGEASEYLQKIMGKINGAIGDIEDVDEAIDANAKSIVEEIKENAVVKESGAVVVQAFYDLDSGEVSWQ